MNTPFKTVYKYYMAKVETYDILNLTDSEIDEDNLNKLMVAMANFTALKNVSMNFNLMEFNRELTMLEVNILSLWMVTEYIKPKVITEENIYDRLGSRDYITHSPANLLDKLINLKKELDSEAHYWTKRYSYLSKKSGDGN